jgi:hypothetical protein
MSSFLAAAVARGLVVGDAAMAESDVELARRGLEAALRGDPDGSGRA